MLRAEADFASDVRPPFLFEKFLLSPRTPTSVTPVKLAAVVKFRPRYRHTYVQSSLTILHIFATHSLVQQLINGGLNSVAVNRPPSIA
jgi:hypothetical protein